MKDAPRMAYKKYFGGKEVAGIVRDKMDYLRSSGYRIAKRWAQWKWQKRYAKDPEAVGVCLMRKQSSREQENDERKYLRRRKESPITTQSGETKVSN